MKILSINGKVGNPIVHRNPKDPAAQFGNLRNANARLKSRYKNIKVGARELIDTFNPVLISNNTTATNKAVYEYQIDSSRFDAISVYLQRLLYGELLDNPRGEFNNRWWLSANLTTAYENGTADTLQSTKNIASVEVVGQEISQQVRSMRLESIVMSPQFQSRIGLIYSRVFESMKGLADSTKTDLADTLARGMASGKGIRALTKDVMKRVNVSHGRAKRIARTEILNSYRTATNQETDDINENVYDDSEWHMVPLWFSALAPTTRKNHASRHGATYTTQQVKDFYSLDGNAINCLCSQSPVLANKKTGAILQEPLQNRMIKQKDAWQAAHGSILTKPKSKTKVKIKQKTKTKPKASYTSLSTDEAKGELSARFPNTEFRSTIPKDMEKMVLNDINQLSRQYNVQAGDDQLKRINFSGNVYGKKRFGKGVGGAVVTDGFGRKEFSLNSKYYKNEKTVRDFYSPGFSAEIDDSNLTKYVTTHEFGHMVYTPSRASNNNRKPIDDDFDAFFNGESYKAHIKVRSKYKAEIRQIRVKTRSEIEKRYKDGDITITQANDELQSSSAKVITEYRNANRDYFVSEYAMTNKNELVAEAFAEYKLNSNPSKISLEIGAIIDKHAIRK